MPDNPSDPLEQAADTAIAVVEEPKHKTKRNTRDSDATGKKDPEWNVILWNDEDHTTAYVIEMLMALFRHSFNVAHDITYKVDREGRAIAFTCHKELAELKRDQVLAYGADPRLPECHLPLRATIEPVPE